MTDADRPAFLGRRVPDAFGVRRITIPPGAERRSADDEWRGAIVILERGAIDVLDPRGDRRRFAPGDMLCLEWVHCERIVNVGEIVAELVAIDRPPQNPAAPRPDSHLEPGGPS